MIYSCTNLRGGGGSKLKKGNIFVFLPLYMTGKLKIAKRLLAKELATMMLTNVLYIVLVS
jgi:hypothetical protein